MKKFDVRQDSNGTDPMIHLQHTFEEIAGKLDKVEDALVKIDPKELEKQDQSVAHLTNNNGLSLRTAKILKENEAEIEVQKPAA